jgi:hypothetical protein
MAGIGEPTLFICLAQGCVRRDPHSLFFLLGEAGPTIF